MRLSFIAAIGLCLTSTAALACSTIRADLSTLTRLPGPFDTDRYVAGQMTEYYLSIGIDGVTLQLSPANTDYDQTMLKDWTAWNATGAQGEGVEYYATYFDQPTAAPPVLDHDGPAFQITQKDGAATQMRWEFIVLNNKLVATALWNGAGDIEDWDGILAEAKDLITLNDGCTSNTPYYDGAYNIDAASYAISPIDKARFTLD